MSGSITNSGFSSNRVRNRRRLASAVAKGTPPTCTDRNSGWVMELFGATTKSPLNSGFRHTTIRTESPGASTDCSLDERDSCADGGTEQHHQGEEYDGEQGAHKPRGTEKVGDDARPIRGIPKQRLHNPCPRSGVAPKQTGRRTAHARQFTTIKSQDHPDAHSARCSPTQCKNWCVAGKKCGESDARSAAECGADATTAQRLVNSDDPGDRRNVRAIQDEHHSSARGGSVARAGRRLTPAIAAD